MSIHIPSAQANQEQKERDLQHASEVTMVTGFTPQFFNRFIKRFPQYWEDMVSQYPYLEEQMTRIMRDPFALWTIRNQIVPAPILEADRSAFTEQQLKERYEDAEFVYVNKAVTLLTLALSPSATALLLEHGHDSVLRGMSGAVNYAIDPHPHSPYHQLFQARTVVSVVSTVAMDTFPDHPIKGAMALLNELNLSEQFLTLILPLVMDQVCDMTPITH